MIPLPAIAIATAVAAAGFAGGWAIKGRLDDAAIARAEARAHECQAQRERDARAAAEETARRLATAQDAERAAVSALQATKTRLAATEKRLKESLYALPTADRCGLSGHARSLLNAAIASDDLPARAAGPDRADASPSADSGGSSEATVGAWIADAIRAYDECRARIDAIRRWDEVTYGR
jgi:hypothetical protein